MITIFIIACLLGTFFWFGMIGAAVLHDAADYPIWERIAGAVAGTAAYLMFFGAVQSWAEMIDREFAIRIGWLDAGIWIALASALIFSVIYILQNQWRIQISNDVRDYFRQHAIRRPILGGE